jgi:hypothetical protein
LGRWGAGLLVNDLMDRDLEDLRIFAMRAGGARTAL